jgi:ATP-binding cassette, subfamily B, bacterial MsbA
VRLVHCMEFERIQNTGPTTLLSYTMTISSQAAFFCSQAATALGSIAMLVLYIAICLTLSWKLTLIAGGTLFLAVQFVRVPLTRRLVEVGRLRMANLVEMNRMIFGGFSGVKLLRLVAGADRHIARIENSVTRYMNNEQRYNHLQSLVDPMFQAVVAIIISAMLFASTLLFDDEAASRIPLILLFLFVLNRVIGPVQTLNRLRLGLASTLPAMHTTHEFVQEAARHKEPDGLLSYPGFRRKVSIERVSFAYSLAKGGAVEEVSFDIPACGMIALVGASGAGKTTLVGLLTRLYRPRTGRIAVDGVDIAELKLAEWRRRIAVIMQDTFLFDDTVAANLRLARPDASQTEIEAAARRAEAHEFIIELPQGYDTVVGERGARLSGGQQQRLAIARALLVEPDLLILDEATSNLDAETEHLVSKVLDAMAQDCAILVIAHRLATVQRADKIVVLDRGRVVETGTHESLMRTRGKYHGMVVRQMFVIDPASEKTEMTAVASGGVGG